MEIAFVAVHQRCIYTSLDPLIVLIKVKLFIKIANEKQPALTPICTVNCVANIDIRETSATDTAY
jgi:hypothetical protein